MRVQSLFVDSERGIIMDKEARDHEFTETSTLESGRETSDAGRSSKNRLHRERSMPAIRDRDRSVLYVGETCPSVSPVCALAIASQGMRHYGMGSVAGRSQSRKKR